MLDKIIILNCRKQAYLIFTDRAPFGLFSNVNVTPLLMWFLGFPNVHLIALSKKETIVDFEIRRNCEDEITDKIHSVGVA